MTTQWPQEHAESRATVILTKVSVRGQMTMLTIHLIGLLDMALLLAQILAQPMTIPREIQKVNKYKKKYKI